MDFNALRARTLGSAADEEAVTVNTRALIDKVLARYSGEWTVLRELLQNAADANASKICIKFETLPSVNVPQPQDTSSSSLLKHIVQNHTLKRLVVTNNGTVFSENDWSRLKRIAEGNPDETKIGAFGVGFYSTFADCEEPFISSGREAMAFFWKNNSLFTRRLKLPDSEANTDTNFVLDYRDTSSPVPPLLPLAQFLANSLTFVGLSDIELWLDQYNLLTLSKKTSPSTDVALPSTIEPKTSEGFMKVTKISKEVAQIDGEWMGIIGWKSAKNVSNRVGDRENAPSLRKFFSRLAGTASQEEVNHPRSTDVETNSDSLSSKVFATIFLNVNTASIKTFTGQKFNEELERATKKPPPKITKLAVLTAPYIENNSLAKATAAGNVFATVLPQKAGKIFIGFPTHQTTGLSAHISAPSVIPTVERESIDLNARYVRTWNIEMLRAAGIVCRIAWISEMAELKDRIVRNANGRSKIRQEDVNPVLSEAITTFNNFTFRESTPSSKTGQILEDAFWTCSKTASIEVLSTCGVLPTHEVRIAPKDLSFMDGIPILPERLVSEAKNLVDKLTDFGLITEVTVSDITKALETNSLTAQQLLEFLSWITKQASKDQLDQKTIKSLLSVAVANDESSNGTPTQVLVLGQIQHFLNPSKTPVDFPVPATVMPFKFTKGLNKQDLESIGWQELQIVPWVRWLIAEHGNRNILSQDQDLTKAPAFSKQLLPILSKQWDSLSQSSKTSLVELLTAHTVVPTKFGMKKPGDAYFPHVKLFDDLATIEGLGSVKDKFLMALGVRKTVELGVVFDRLLTKDSKSASGDPENKPKWSHVDLLHYLASVREDIPSADIKRLKNTAICPKQTDSEGGVEETQLYKVSELFEPKHDLKELGLPILAWPGVFRSNSPEGKFLSTLGLRTMPEVAELIDIMARAGIQGNLVLRDKTLAYFLSRHHANGYGSFNYSAVTVKFLPLLNKPKQFAAPSQCFIDEGAALLGFDVIQRDWAPHAQRFGVRVHPPIDSCIYILGQRPPTTRAHAQAIFSYFAGRLGEITGSIIPRLTDLKFVPIFSTGKSGERFKEHVSPKACFLGESETFGEIFNYVDFGQESNAFLIKCGSKIEPTKLEIAQILVREPARIFSTFGNIEKYLTLLRNMAEDLPTLKRHKDLYRDMKSAPFLIAYKEVPRTQSQPNHSIAQDDEFDDLDDEESQTIREYQLCGAQEAVVIDEFLHYGVFRTEILSAPQEEHLEQFYHSLGSPYLSSLVEEAAKHGPRAADQKPAQKLQKLVFERSRLFLHDQPVDAIKHDALWLEKNLQVQLVSSITLRRSLRGRGITHTEKRSATVVQSPPGFTLYINSDKPNLYQVGQALGHLLLHRPKPHSALTFEMILKTDLYELRARGFNVSRILRQKQAEARLAESKRQAALEEERRRIEEQEQAWKAAQQEAKQNKLPGNFPDSPERDQSDDEAQALTNHGNHGQQSSRGLFSNLSRQLGLNNNRHIQSFLGHSPHEDASNSQVDAPPPYSAMPESTGQPKQTGGSVTAPHQLRENLLNAIKKTRPHNSSAIFSRGETNTVSETKSYCDEHPAHDLKFIADIKHGIQMFLPPTLSNKSTSFLQDNSANLTSFATLLKKVGDIFSLDPKTLNIFYEAGGKTIAFNRNGSIFCNFLYFQQLHEKIIQDTKGYSEAFVYWWVILCHELAHNLVEDHSSDHSYYTEGFVGQYFMKVIQALSQASINNEPQQLSINV